MFKYGVFSGPHFPVFGLNTEIYGVNIRIQTEYREIRTRKSSVFGHFSRSVIVFGATSFKVKLVPSNIEERKKLFELVSSTTVFGYGCNESVS